MAPMSLSELLCLFMPAFLYSVMGAFMKEIPKDIPSTQITFYRASFQGILAVMGMMYLPHPDNNSEQASSRTTCLLQYPVGPPGQRSLVLARGAVAGFTLMCYLYTVKALPLGDAITLLSLCPIITILLSRIFLGYEIIFGNVIAALCSLVGALLIASPSFDLTGPGNYLGCITGILGSTGTSVMYMLTRHAALKVHPFQHIFSSAVFSVLFSLCVGHTIGIGIEQGWQMPHTKGTWGWVSGVVISGASAQFIIVSVCRTTSASTASLARSTDIMWAYMWDVLIFDQAPTTKTTIGVIIVCLSIILVTTQKMAQENGIANASENTSESGSKNAFEIASVNAKKYATNDDAGDLRAAYVERASLLALSETVSVSQDGSD